jgi:hypothetical protein
MAARKKEYFPGMAAAKKRAAGKGTVGGLGDDFYLPCLI